MTKHLIIDTDIGFDPDDFVALLLALNSPGLNVDLVLTGGYMRDSGYTIVNKVLELTGHKSIPLIKGAELFFGAIYNKTASEINKALPKHDYLNAVKETLESNEHVYYLGIGPMTSLANYLRVHNNHKKITLVQMGGSNIRQEFNFSGDIDAAKYVFSSGIEAYLVTAEITNNESNHASHQFLKSVESSPLEVHKLLFDNISKMQDFHLHDPLTLATIIDNEIVHFEPMSMSFDKDKQTFTKKRNSNLHVSTSADYSKIVQLVDSLLE